MKRAISLISAGVLFLISLQANAATIPITIVASGDTAGGASPTMVVYVDGTKISTTSITANHSQGKTQTVSFTRPTLPQKVEIAFTNDFYNSKTGADRNLYIISLTVNGVKYLPTQAVLDLGSDTWTDSKNTAAGESLLYANSKLDFTISQGSVVNGACGSSNGTDLTAAPSANLCTTGTASTVAGTGPWNWSCTGSGGGTTSQCSASLLQNGACGASNGANLSAKPTANLCTIGTASTISGTGPWKWSCAGVNGGAAASCATAALTPVNGACGVSNGTALISAPTTGLCNTGTASSVGGTGPWNWSCTGSNGGTSAQCSAQLLSVNGSCGTANGTSGTTKPTANLCNSGAASAVGGTGPWTWSCAGQNGGKTAQCSENLLVNGACGASSGVVATTKPTTNLCTIGTASAVGGTNPWSWSCAGSNGGTTASCATLKQSPVNGACGSANGVAVTAAPATNLCSIGAASTVAGTGPWNWNCSGSNGGTNATCTAPLQSSVPYPMLPLGYLSTQGNQIVDSNGNPVRLHCVGWAGMNAQYNEPDNLEAIDYHTLMNTMVSEGFNCFRMSWNDVTLMTNSMPGGGISFTANPELSGLTQMQVEDAILAYANQIGLKVILDHHDNESTGLGPTAWACSGQQANGLWYDLGPGTNNTDGCGNAGTVTQQTFLNNWIAIAERYASYPAVIGFDLDNEPNTVGATGANNATGPAANWGQGGPTDIRAMYSEVGSAIQAVNPNALIIVEGPGVFNWEQSTLLSGGPLLQTGVMDLSLAGSMPVQLTVPNKLVYSIHDYPASISSATPDSGTNMIKTINAAWGYLETQNIAPVWIGEMGASLDGTNDSAGANLADEQAWASALLAYVNGQDGSVGGPTFSGNQQPISTDWWTFGYLYGSESPDGTLESDYTTPNPAQAKVYNQLLPVKH